MSDLEARRAAEVSKYDPMDGSVGAYAFKNYCMTDVLKERLWEFVQYPGGDYLDVGCGRGESLAIAEKAGMHPYGVEAVPMLVDAPNKVNALLPDLPFGDQVFHVVTCLDVMEHILEDDWMESIKEMARVCSHRLVLSISNVPDRAGEALGVELHISRFPYEQIDNWLFEWLPGWEVTWRKDLSMDHAEVWDCVRCST